MLALQNVSRVLANSGGRLVIALIGTLFTAGVLLAQDEVIVEQFDGAADSLQYSLTDGCDECGDATCGGHAHAWPRFGMYLKSGPSFQMGKSLFEEKTEVGYEIAFGGREPLLPTDTKVFFDFGGSYLSAFGEGRSQTVSGTFNGTTFLQDFFEMSLEEISRTSVHSSIGWYHELSHVPEVSRILTFRIGGRLSHIRGHFAEDPSAELQDLIDAATGAFTLAKSQLISQTDVSPGMFAGFELYSARYISQGATISFVCDAVFAADWVKLEGYKDGTLATANVLFGLSVNR